VFKNKESAVRLPFFSRLGAVRWVLCALLSLSVTACGGGGGSGGGSGGSGTGGGTATTYTVGGTVSGLNAAGLVLTDNGGNALSVASGASTFTFTQALQSGASYSVAVSTQPTGETCAVGSGSGTVSANVTNVTVTCQPLYTIGGTITGLSASGLTLDNNGTAALAVPYTTGQSSSMSFTFGQSVPAGTQYDVTVGAQPSGETCTVSSGSGTVSANVTTIAVSCAAQTFTVSGTISGLTNSGLKLQDYTGGETISVAANATTFAFTNPVPYGTNIAVTVAQQPYWEWCTAGTGNFSGPITGNVTSESFACASATASGASLTTKVTFKGPAGIAVDSAGDVFVADSLNSRVIEITAGGAIQTVMDSSSSPGLVTPEGVAVDSSGNVYISDNSTNGIFKVSPSGSIQQLAAGYSFSSPVGLAVDSAGNVYVANSGANNVVEIPAGGGTPQVIGTFAAPDGVAVDSKGNLYVADTGANLVAEVPAGGGTARTLSNAFLGPQGVAVDAAGDVYVADTNANQVKMISAQGTVSTLAGVYGNTGLCTSNPPLFGTPFGIAVNSSGVLYVTDFSNNDACTLTAGP
jgi:sugar lactone lactonase YvrE